MLEALSLDDDPGRLRPVGYAVAVWIERNHIALAAVLGCGRWWDRTNDLRLVRARRTCRSERWRPHRSASGTAECHRVTPSCYADVMYAAVHLNDIRSITRCCGSFGCRTGHHGSGSSECAPLGPSSRL